MLTDFQLGWVAGFLEGEGSFRATKNQWGCRCAQIQASQMVKEPLEFLQRLCGGTLKQYKHKRLAGDQFQWEWWVCGKKARFLMKDLYGYMSKKRCHQIDLALTMDNKDDEA